MPKSWKFIAVAAALAAFCGAGAAPAAAQQTSNGMLSGGSGTIMSLISASDVASMMTELGVTTELKAAADGSPYLLAAAGGGGRFVFRFFGCESAVQATGCRNTIVTAALPSAGVSYDDLNNFNGASVVTTAVNIPEQQIIIFGRNIIILGGHSRDLFKGTVYLFLRDVDSFASSRSSAASVSFSKEAPARSKISGVQGGGAEKGPTEVFGVSDLQADISAAIANTNDIDFAVDYEPEQ
jgi:hypothetical protein